jgi:hypothetical protein
MDDRSLSDWLRQRERADWRSRARALTERACAALPRDRPVRVLDLATGEGSNLRYLVERLPPRQRWLLTDRSQLLLSHVLERTRDWAAGCGYRLSTDAAGFTISGRELDCRVKSLTVNLGSLDDPALFAGRDLVTASALLDLVSESWLGALAAHCRTAGAVALFTISYDGRFACEPPEPEDGMVRARMNEHQHRDKGLGGPAAGPDAAACAVRCFRAEGYHVDTSPSDWELGPEDAGMQRTLIDGWAEAAAEAAPADSLTIASWRSRRLAHVDAGRSHLVVGHHDMVAWRTPVA